MRLIDGHAVMERLQEQTAIDSMMAVGMLMAQRTVLDAPAIDAVEVVRCRDCEWWRCNPNTEEYGVCKKVSYDDFEVVMACDDFCSYGLRREDGEA